MTSRCSLNIREISPLSIVCVGTISSFLIICLLTMLMVLLVEEVFHSHYGAVLLVGKDANGNIATHLPLDWQGRSQIIRQNTISGTPS